jgi:predicted acetyltransferase
MKTNFALIQPTTALKTSFLEGLREFQDEGLAWHANHDLAAIESNFDDYIKKLCAPTYHHPVHHVPQTVMWGTWKNEFAGLISIRHTLNDDLKIMGGHIGYDTRPLFRGKGIATLMLKAALPIAKQIGLTRVLLTCNDDNIASIKVIEKNGGLLEKTALFEQKLKRYYWIKL